MPDTDGAFGSVHHRVRQSARRNLRWALLLGVFSLLSGTVGFVNAYAPCAALPASAGPCADLTWSDALLDASMLLGGMGPVHADRLVTTGAKLFASAYALYSGLVFLILAALILGPVFQHGLHRFHLEADKGE